MKTIITSSHDPRYNLALEEYVLKHLASSEDFVWLWQNDNSVIIGRHQNTIEEINAEYVKSHNVNVVRRISGGGAVYHDKGNLNFSFVTAIGTNEKNNYRRFTDPVIFALNSLGIKAEFSGRNDILVDGKKISGNAQSYYADKMLHHGTILFDVDLDHMVDALKVKADKIESKGIKSYRSRVTNIRPLLKKDMDIESFSTYLLTSLMGNKLLNSSIYQLSKKDKNEIAKLVESKYSSWEWNYGSSPSYSVEKRRRYTGGELVLRFNIENGYINQLKINGDFLSCGDCQEVEKSLQGMVYKLNEVEKIISTLGLENFMVNITNNDFIDCLFN